MGNIVVGLTMFIQYLMRNHDKPSKFPGYPFTDKPNYHEKWLQYFAVTVDNQIQQDSHHLSCASRRALHCSHPWGKLIAAGMLRGIPHHDDGFVWFQEYWFPCNVCLLHLVSSTCASHPQKTCLDASTSGVHGFPGLAAWTQHPFEGDVQNRQDGWVGHGGTWWDMVGHWIYQAMCLIVFWVKTRQHPDICHKTHEKLFQSVVIITVIFVGMGKKGQGWHRVTYQPIVIFSHLVPHTLLGICKGLIWGLLNLSFRLLNVISSMAGCFKGVVTLLLSRLAPPG